MFWASIKAVDLITYQHTHTAQTDRNKKLNKDFKAVGCGFWIFKPASLWALLWPLYLHFHYEHKDQKTAAYSEPGITGWKTLKAFLVGWDLKNAITYLNCNPFLMHFVAPCVSFVLFYSFSDHQGFTKYMKGSGKMCVNVCVNHFFFFGCFHNQPCLHGNKETMSVKKS